MKRALSFILLALSLLALPGPAISKDRGCRNNFVRAREKAFEEGCLSGTRWDRNTRYDRDPNYQDRGRDDFDSNRRYSREDQLRQRRDQLVQLGYRRGLSRDEFRELEDLRNRIGR
jgi:hypothetical protein